MMASPRENILFLYIVRVLFVACYFSKYVLLRLLPAPFRRIIYQTNIFTFIMKITSITVALFVSILFSAVAPIAAGKNKNKRNRERVTDLNTLLATSQQNAKSSKSEAPTDRPSGKPSPSPSMMPSFSPTAMPTGKSGKSRRLGATNLSDRLAADADDMPSSSAITSAAVQGSESKK